METITSTCPECATDMVEPANGRLGEVVECSGCAAELEITGVAPYAYELAPEVEEDWGE